MWIWLCDGSCSRYCSWRNDLYLDREKAKRREMETLLELAELVLEEKEVTNRTAGEETIYAKIEDRRFGYAGWL